MPNSSDFNRFAVNPVNVDIQRSLFNMEHTVKFTAKLGEVTPFEVREVLPGDTFTCDTTKVIRIQPLVAPIMDEIVCDTYYFFVPNRLVWEHWKEFCGENTQSPWAPSTSYVVPKLQSPEEGMNVGTIWDYFGLPTGVGYVRANALPFRAYAKVCDDWFRSEAVNTPINIPTGDYDDPASNGSDQVEDIALGGAPFKAAKLFDYFTACLPSPQKGAPVDVSLLGLAPVYALGDTHFKAGDYYDYINGADEYPAPITFAKFSSTNQRYDSISGNVGVFFKNNNIGSSVLSPAGSSSSVSDFNMIPNNLWADLSTISAFTINDLRTAFAVQRYLEKSARYGSRYIEFVKAFFNVDSPDSRLQRSEYLGGSRMPLNINSIHQTTSANNPTNLDALARPAGISVTGEQNSDFTYSATEHGFLLGLCVFRYHHSYQQGVERFWSRETLYDYYLPTFANLGEMAVKNKEIYATGQEANPTDVDNQVFGYQEAWADYRYAPNKITSGMRQEADNLNLSYWHLGDYYESTPSLSSSWLAEDPYPLNRALAYTDFPPFMCDFLISMKAARPMPLYSIPGLIDHH